MDQKILVIDCHPVYAQKTLAFLQGLTLKNITLAKNGEEGLSSLKNNLFDLVILSGMLPDMQSIDVCKQVHILSGEGTKIIVQIGLFMEDKDIEQFLENGANKVLLRKEKDLNPLQDAIEDLLFEKV